VDDLSAMKSEDVGLIVRAISFQDFQPMWSWSTNATDRQTCDRMTMLKYTTVYNINKAIVDRLQTSPPCRILTNSTKHCPTGTATWRTFSNHNVVLNSGTLAPPYETW